MPDKTPEDLGQELIQVAGTTDITSVNRLIAQGARLDEQDSIGNMPLNIAVWHQQPQAVQSLIKAGAPLNHKNLRGNTPFMLATLRDDELITSILIAAGADIHATDHDGKTALYYARLKNRTGIVNMIEAEIKEREAELTKAQETRDAEAAQNRTLARTDHGKFKFRLKP